MGKRLVKSGSPREQYLQQQSIQTDIIENLRDLERYKKSIKKLKVQMYDDPLNEPELRPRRLLTNTALDRVLSRNGGIEAGRTVEFWGAFATGKTQVCETLVVEAPGKIAVIDAENTFSPDRVREIAIARGKDPIELSSRILLFIPAIWMEQEAAFVQLPEFDENDKPVEVGLIILDSLMKHWRSAPEFYGRDKNTTRQQLIRNELENLARYARRHNGIFVFTNQIMDKVTDTTMLPPEEKVKPSGGPTVEHFADYRIFLRKGRGSIRFARVVDSIDLPLLEVPFILHKNGIVDIPDPVERAKAVMLGEEYGSKFKSGQVGAQDAGKDYIKEALKRGYINETEAESQGLSKDEITKAIDEQKKTLDDRLKELSDEEAAVLESSEESSVESTAPDEQPVGV